MDIQKEHQLLKFNVIKPSIRPEYSPMKMIVPHEQMMQQMFSNGRLSWKRTRKSTVHAL